MRIEADLVKARKALKILPLLILVVGGSTAAHYAGLFSSGFLPDWLGIVLVVGLVIQTSFLSRKVNQLEEELEMIRTGEDFGSGR